jgi:hypothetical protein
MPGSERQILVLVCVVDGCLDVNNHGIVTCSGSQCGRCMQLLSECGSEVYRNMVLGRPMHYL